MTRSVDQKDTNETRADPKARSPEGVEEALNQEGGETRSTERAARSSRRHTSHVVIGPSRSAKRIKDPEGAAWIVLMMAGATFLLLGLAETVLLWIPVQMGNPAWEFATLSRMLDAGPMFVLGFALLAYAQISRHVAQKKHVRPLAVSSAAVAVVLLALAGLYMTVAPVVLSSTPPEAMYGVRRAIVKSSLQLAVYCAFFGSLSVALWNRIMRSD